MSWRKITAPGTLSRHAQAVEVLPRRRVARVEALQRLDDDPRAGGGQAGLEGVDVLVARAPDLLGNEAVHADDEHVLVVRAVEDGDPAGGRRDLVDPPQEVVGELILAGLLER